MAGAGLEDGEDEMASWHRLQVALTTCGADVSVTYPLPLGYSRTYDASTRADWQDEMAREGQG